MKTFTAIPLLAFTTLFLASCDPIKRLVIKAGNSNTFVAVYTNKKILPCGNREDNSKIIIQVPYNDTTRKTFNYGIGYWPGDAITNLAANIDSIVIKNTNGKVVLIGKTDIERYLKKHRSGYARSVLTIEAK